MNEIQRFKKERMIGKYQAGKPITIGGVTYTPEGNHYYYFTNHRGHRQKNTITAQEFQKIRQRTPTEETLGGYVREKNRSLFGSGYRWYDASKPKSAVAIDKEIEVGDWIIKPNGTKVHKSVRQQNTNNGQPAATQKKGRRFIDSDGSEYWLGSDGSKTLLKKGTSSTGDGRRNQTGVVGPKTSVKGQQYWDNNFQTMRGGLSSQQQMYLDSLGIDMSSAETIQAGINKYLGNNNLAVDNKWGNKSQRALDALLRYMPKDYQNDDMKQGLANEVNLPNDAVIDAPDPFGYKTSNTYEDDNFTNKVKALGIGSNADLINFMYKSGKEGWKGDAWQTQFRSDVDRALGGDYSDDNIRKVFGTQGKWGRGFMGRGDFGDFQNALQTNSGVWNGMYNAKEQASRTDANGTVYSSPEMMKKFEKIELQPNQNNQGLTSNTKFDFSNMKFNNIFTGAQTIGNMPTTVPTDKQTKFTQQIG